MSAKLRVRVPANFGHPDEIPSPIANSDDLPDVSPEDEFRRLRRIALTQTRGEGLTPVRGPRVPPHQRHLSVSVDACLSVYSEK